MIAASVVIPTYNRASSLLECLEALARQTCPPQDFEVVVVVDGSTDDTMSRLNRFQSPYPLRVVEQPNAGQPAALNRGAQDAHGRICIFLDDDIRVAPEFIAEHIRLHQVHDQAIGIGQITLSLPADADWFARQFAQEWAEHYAELNQGTRQPGWQDCFGGNMSVLRQTFLNVGGNNLDLNRAYDYDLAYRLYRAGGSFSYLPKALGEQFETKGWRDLSADSEKGGVASVALYRRHPEMLPVLLGGFAAQQWSLAWLIRSLIPTGLRVSGLKRWQDVLGIYATPAQGYRLIQRYAFWRGVHRAMTDRDEWRRVTSGTPVLMYHAVGARGEPASRFVIPATRFAHQMRCLKWLGFQILSVEEWLSYRREFRLPPTRAVVITFDDGFADNKDLALPVLRRYGFPATIFLVADWMGRSNDWEQGGELAGRKLLTWQDCRVMLSDGISFGAHSRHHPNLVIVPPEQAREEILGAKEILERELGMPVRAFAYPYGSYNSAVQTFAEQAGYWGSFGIDPGLNIPAMSLSKIRRIEIDGNASLLDFLAAIFLGERLDTVWERIGLLISGILHLRRLFGRKKDKSGSPAATG